MENYYQGMTDSVNNMDFSTEIQYKTTTSSGKGGQHVNKVSSRVVLIFNIKASKFLTHEQKKMIQNHLQKRVDKNGCIQMSSQKTRSQHQNKIIVTTRFYSLIFSALTPDKERIATKPTKASKLKRKELKKKVAEKKNRRKKPGFKDINNEL